MYSHLPPEPINIHMMQDLLLIQLSDFTQEAVYIIKNQAGQTIRKGRFKGNSIQLNLIHLSSGHYELGLSQQDNGITYYFEKQDGFYIFSGKYDVYLKNMA